MGPLRQGLAALAALGGAPVALGALALRPEWRVGLRERLGAAPRLAPGAVWVHAASVGEALAATRLIDRLRDGGTSVFVTTGTVTGRDVLRRARPEVPCALAPLDHPWPVDAALARVRPSALVLVETELWPVWIRAAARRAPVVVVSGRISDRSFPRYRRASRLMRPTLDRIEAVGARTDTDAGRFAALGVPEARISVTGDLKLDPPEREAPLAPDLDSVLGGGRGRSVDSDAHRTGTPPGVGSAQRAELKARGAPASDRPLLVAGSTHAGEEEAALAALAAAERAGWRASLVLAPRHLARAGEVEALVKQSGRAARRRTAVGARPLEPGEVLVLDSVGELAAVYRRAALAFVGGSLAPVGGHNLLEPVFAGCPVLFGPHTGSQLEPAALLLEAGAGRRVHDAQELASAVLEHLAAPDTAADRVQRARGLLETHRGAARRSADLVAAVLARRGELPS